MSLVKQGTRSLTAGFNGSVLKKATAILLGNISTTFYLDQIASRVPMVRSNPIFEIGSLLLLSGGNALVAKKIWPKHASDILVGGILAAVTRGVKTVLPGRFSTCGLGEDMEGLGMYEYVHGLGNFVIGPHSTQTAFSMSGYGGPMTPKIGTHGLGWAPGPNMPEIGTHGLGDEAVYQQVQGNQGHNLVTLDGLANLAVMQEIESMS